jgi:putative peptidoglycan lipid II flippase
MPDITRGVRAFTIGTAISRILGLVRESVFAFLFGAGFSTDAFNAAFRIPNLFRDLFAETSLSAAFIPILTAQKQQSKEQQNLLASNVFNILLLIVGGVVVLGVLLSPVLVKAIAFGFGAVPNKLSLTAQLTAVMFPFLLFVSLAAWAMGYLNTEREFFVPAVAPAFFNVISIAVPLLLYAYLVHTGTNPILGMAVGVLGGGLIQFLIQIPMLYRKGFRYKLYLNFNDPQMRKIFALFLPVALGLAASRINIFVDTLLVSFLQERSLTWINYAFRVMHLPLGLFGIAVGTVTLPTFSAFVAKKQHDELRATLFDSLKLIFLLTVASAVIIAFLSHPITRIIYERGRFTAFDTSATVQALILYVIGIPFMASIRNVAAVYYAYKDAKTPMYASFVSVAIHIVMNLVLMRIIGYRAFPLSTTVSSCINVVILFAFLPRKIGAFRVAPLMSYFVRLVIAATIGGVCALFLHGVLESMLEPSFLSYVVALLASGVAALVVCYAACLVLGVTEAREYVKRLLKS